MIPKRPYTIFFSQKELELVSLLVAVAAGGVIVQEQKWVAIAQPLNARLNKLIIKFQKDVQLLQEKSDPLPSVPPVL